MYRSLSFALAQVHRLRFGHDHYREMISGFCHLAEAESLSLARVVEHCGADALAGGVAYSVYILHFCFPLSFLSDAIIHHEIPFVNRLFVK